MFCYGNVGLSGVSCWASHGVVLACLRGYFRSTRLKAWADMITPHDCTCFIVLGVGSTQLVTRFETRSCVSCQLVTWVSTWSGTKPCEPSQ